VGDKKEEELGGEEKTSLTGIENRLPKRKRGKETQFPRRGLSSLGDAKEIGQGTVLGDVPMAIRSRRLSNTVKGKIGKKSVKRGISGRLRGDAREERRKNKISSMTAIPEKNKKKSPPRSLIPGKGRRLAGKGACQHGKGKSTEPDRT